MARKTRDGRKRVGRVIVAGSINMDVVARAPRFPARGETIMGDALDFFPGGKGANQAVAAAKLGAPTMLIGRLGTDAFGAELETFLAGQGVDLTEVRRTPAPTGTALITLAEGDNTIVVVPGANALVTEADIGAPDLAAGDVLVSQFEIPQQTIAAFFARGRAAGARTILNPAPALACTPALLALVDILVLNETELSLLAGCALADDAPRDAIVAAARTLRGERRMRVCVTLGARGAIAIGDGEAIAIEGRSVAVRDTTGAGDCFVGALAARLAQGDDFAAALAFANAAASISVQRLGAAPSMPDATEVASVLSPDR
jgi:ribokinase